MASEFGNRRAEIMTFLKGLKRARQARRAVVATFDLILGDVPDHSTILCLCWRLYLSLMSKMLFSARIHMHLPASS